MSKKKLLVAGGGHSDIPLIKAGKALGFHVITSGYNAHDLGHKYSDEHHLRDFSDQEAILKLARDLEVDFICPCANDFSAISCAFAAQELNLPGHDTYETALTIHHKDRYREFAQKHDLLTPKAKGFSDIEEAFEEVQTWGYPIIIKPVDLSGGKGVTKVTKAEELRHGLLKASVSSKAKRFVVEEFVEGTNHGYTSFLRDGKIVFYAVDDEHYYLNKFLVSGASMPTSVPQSAVNLLTQESERICDLLGLNDGLFHIQFILKDGRPYILEITRRAPGDLYVDLVKHAAGVPYAEYIVKVACGMDIADLNAKSVEGYTLRHCIMSSEEGKISSVDYDPIIKDKVVEELILGRVGDRIADKMTYKYGISFIKFDSIAEMRDLSPRMQELIKVSVE